MRLEARTLLVSLALLCGAGLARSQTTNPYPMRQIVLMLPATYAGAAIEAMHFDPRVRDGVLYLWPSEATAPVGGTNTINGITNLNGLTLLVQTFNTGTAGTDFAIVSAGGTHTWNLPTASAANRGALSSADWNTFNSKQAGDPDLTALANIAGVQGDIIYHNGASWVRLGAGTSGYKLETRGVGANPVWDTDDTGGGTNTLYQILGSTLGSAGTANFGNGITGALSGVVVHLGVGLNASQFSATSIRTNAPFTNTLHYPALYVFNDGSSDPFIEFRAAFGTNTYTTYGIAMNSGSAFTITAQGKGWSIDTAGTLQTASIGGKLTIGSSADNVSIYARTNRATFDITTNDFVLNQYYTNSNQRSWVAANLDLPGTAQASLFLDQDADGTWERTGLTATNSAQLSAMLQPSARFLWTNQAGSPVVRPNSSQWVRQ